MTIDLCPLADPGLLAALGDRGYRATEFNNVLVKRLAGSEMVFTPRVRRAIAGEAELWAHTVGHGFFEQAELTSEEMDVGRAIFAMPGALCYLAVSESGEPAGGGAAAMRDGLATLFADSTLSQFRRRGLHRRAHRRAPERSPGAGLRPGHGVHAARQHLAAQLRTARLRSGLHQGDHGRRRGLLMN